MVTLGESLNCFLAQQRDGRARDLVERVVPWGTAIELYVDVNPAGGTLVAGTTGTYTDGVETWHSIHVPRNSHSKPNFADNRLTFQFDKYVESINTSGWLWEKKLSLWCAFDMELLRSDRTTSARGPWKAPEVIATLDYAELRKSPCGEGQHLYVYLPDGVATNTHLEHAAVAREVLAHISDEIGFRLCENVGACGSSLPVWSRIANDENQGLALIKSSTRLFPHDLKNWQAHLPVVRRLRPRVQVCIPGFDDGRFDELTAGMRRAPLDQRQIAVRNALAAMGGSTWNYDYHILQTHTALLKRIREEGKLSIRGAFETVSVDIDPDSPVNCFMFPIENGSWKVFRIEAGVVEDKLWTRNTAGWTTTYFDRKSDFITSAISAGGRLLAKGGVEFATLAAARPSISDFSLTQFEVPDTLASRRATVKQAGNCQLVIQVAKSEEDGTFAVWNSSDKKGYWTQVITTQAERSEPDNDYDQLIRCLETPSRQPAGWALCKDDHSWTFKSSTAIKTALQSVGRSKSQAEVIMGHAERRPWMLVTQPFDPEYPGNRRWNRAAPQLAVNPAPPNDGQTSQHPHWDIMLDHIGSTLSGALKSQPWALGSGITTGRQYLMAWYASILRYPFAHLPYLFLYGPENSGKSVFHEAFSLLVTRGVAKADSALTEQFNSALEGCILAVVEERNVANVQGTHAKIKDYVTGENLAIRRMRTDIYEVPNTTHWVQCSNDVAACPVFQGDTRITVLHVPKLENEIPKQVFKQRLKSEAPFFVTTLLNMRLPKPTTRLRIPVVTTSEKSVLALNNQTQVQWFVNNFCQPGNFITVRQFNEAFEYVNGEKPVSGELLSLMADRRNIRKGPSVTRKIDGKNAKVISGLDWNEQGLDLIKKL